MAMPRLWILAATIGVLWFLVQGPDARADTWNKKTKVTFNEPVELPGGVVLPSGDYVLKLMDSPADRHIVQVFNSDEDHLYATILAIPNYRMEPSGKTVITFYETPTGQPKFIRAWFYPGDNFGQAFAYPKDRATYLAKATGTSVPVEPSNKEEPVASAMSSGADEVAVDQEPEYSPAPQESTQTTEIAQVTTPASSESNSVQPSETMADGEGQENEEPSRLPETGSSLPLLGLTGLLSLASALGVRLLALRRSS